MTTKGWKLMEGAAPAMTPISFATISSAGLRVRQRMTSSLVAPFAGHPSKEANLSALLKASAGSTNDQGF